MDLGRKNQISLNNEEIEKRDARNREILGNKTGTKP